MTRALVLYAHPVPESFSGVLHSTVTGALTDRGWQVDDCDLNAEGFSPVLTADERRGYHDIGPNLRPVQDYVDRVRAAEALVLVFPVWNFGYPAILKGFFDRVFLPGVSFKLENGKLSGNLHNIRSLTAVTTYGATRLRATLVGNPPRRSVSRHLRAVVHPRARMKYLALYDMNNADQAVRERFRVRVHTAMSHI